jgi:hypothetical protein
VQRRDCKGPRRVTLANAKPGDHFTELCFFYDFPVILLEFPILYGDCVQQPVRGQIMGDATPLRHLAFGPRRVYEPLGDAWRACTAVPEIPVGNKKNPLRALGSALDHLCWHTIYYCILLK